MNYSIALLPNRMFGLRYAHEIRLFFYGYVYLPILLVGTMGSLVIVVVFIKHKRWNKPGVIYMFCLAITDGMYSLLSGIFTWLNRGLASLTDGRYSVNIFGSSQLSCKLLILVVFWCMGASAFITIAMTLERFCAIQFPMHMLRVTRRMRIILLSSAAVLFALLEVRQLFFFEVAAEEVTRKFMCTESRAIDPDIMFSFRFLLMLIGYYVIPSVLLLVINALICWALFRAYRTTTNDRTSLGSGGKRHEKGISITLMAVASIFVLCNPMVSGLFYGYNVDKNPHLLSRQDRSHLVDLYWVASGISYINNATSLPLYVIRLSYFRVHLSEIFCRLCLLKRNRSDSH
ncbi:neuropeptides capa receptor-like [Tubulanus polymorphus]|uniref:neuropeptides capa receptor-like n=1 Tax=Tubulanus polymorphus TaxID=672921 RepID=UPI003DA58085